MNHTKESQARTLQELSPGESGMIVSVGNQSGAVKRRLVDMGLTPGTVVKVTKIAPLGDPLEVSLRGYELSLRKEDAGQIQIGPVQAKPQAASKPGAPDPERDRRQLRDHVHELEHHEKPYDHNAHDTRTMKVALAGNPNCGKTTLFNALTGSNQYVGNWPGVTVEKKEGTAHLGDRSITVVDLPGIYSLSPYSMEEIVARDFIIGEGPDAVIDIVDATNLERNLYLTVQLLELERPLVLALNFMDEVKARGDQIDVERLSKELGVPVVPITAKTGEGLDELLQVAHRQMHLGVTYEPDDLYDDFTHDIHHRMGELIHDYAYAANLPAHWASIKLLEGDGIVAKALNLPADVQNKLDAIIAEYEASSALGDRETLVADSRYRYIERVVHASVVKGKGSEGPTLTEKIDRIVTGKYTALPLFLCAMLVMFVITFGPFGSWLQDGVSALIDLFSGWLEGALTAAGAPAVVISLVCDGIISGVGGVLSFLPQIALLFFFLSFLEDSGYMSRAAFIMDRLLRRFGLSGKAFIPMLMGFGCSVPAIMGARTMENEKDRRMTILLIPFMSCSAKLPVYGLLSAAFFGPWAGLVVFGLYVIGMVVGILSGILFKHTLFAGEPAPFVLELPPYRFPSMENIATHVWQKVKGFLVKAGTLILAMSIVLWLLQSFDFSLHMVDDAANSMLGTLGALIAPVFAPLGFGFWQAAVALLTGFIAKEMVVSSLSMFYGFSLTAAGTAVAAAMTGFTPLSAFSMLVFILLYVPCVAATSTMAKELGSAKWTVFSVCWQIGVAYVVSLLVHTVGLALGFV
ncbi:ferrous iron transport protein B [Pseudoflavonifractor capillosus]|uniref:ferrous iron transport protein B n=1 Tax=Pseudoflavonifractor capillosus TaxID=106588 RepID=UPI00195684FB|nr:ferrous iron transport protein B [Pseudoflavonifractor capillosus]MBM6680593.1 ferrous iron transport protein B [Pseudoflavonifractor capillosus]